MNSALIIEVFVLVLGLFYLGNYKSDKARKSYIIITMLLLIIESGLRAKSVGPDTMNYYYWFEQCKGLSWSDVFNNTMEDRDPGFSVLMKSIQLLSGDFNFFLTIGALWFFIPLSIILYRYSSHIFQLIFAFTLYLSLFHIIALSGIRQQFAMGFSFWAFLLYKENKYILASLLLIVGSYIHVSLLLFSALPIIHFFVSKRLYKTIHLISIILVPFVFVGAKFIVRYMASFLSDDYYMGYVEKDGSGAVVYIILMEILSLFCFLVIKRDTILKNGNLAYLYINLPLLTFFVPLVALDGAMIRMGQYFTMYMMLLFPYAVDTFSNKRFRSIIYIISIIILVFYVTKSSIEYEFCF